MRKGLQRLTCMAFIAIALLVVIVPVGAAIPGLQGKEGFPTLAPLLEKVTPAVVNISVISRVAVEENPLMQDPFFHRHFIFRMNPLDASA